MALGFQVDATVERRDRLDSERGRRQILRQIQQELLLATDDPLLTRLLHAELDQEQLRLQVHPAARPLLLEFTPEGQLRCQASTTGAGPGYHVFLIEALSALEQRVGLRWGWDEADETGLLRHQSFPQLQLQTLAWLQELGTQLLRDSEWTTPPLLVSLPRDYPIPRSDAFAISPTGAWPRQWFEELPQDPPPVQARKASAFFPWWHRGLDGRFWRGCGLTLAWIRLPWRCPASRSERSLYDLTERCFARARELQPGIQLPREIEELRALCRKDADPQRPPDAEGIGFKRHPMRTPLPGGWSISLPGYYLRDPGMEEGVCSWRFGTRRVRVACSWFHAEEDPEGYLPSLPPAIGQARIIELPQEGLRGRAFRTVVEHDGQQLHELRGTAVRTGALCQVTIDHEDPEDAGWAIDTWQSLRHSSIG